jgi:RHS repeat-associated protein
LTSYLSSLYQYNELNRLLEDDRYIYSYDADGNLTSKEDKTTDEITHYYYDAENKLVQVERYDSTSTLISTISYAYDGFGRRVKKDVDEVVTYYIYDEEDIRFEMDESGNIIAEYTHGPGIDEPLAINKNGQDYYYHFDGLGSVTAITDKTGNVVQRYEYDSFGNIIYQQDSNFVQPYTYASREYDSESGLYYYRARYYTSTIGRFISFDPLLRDSDYIIDFPKYMLSIYGFPISLYQGLNPYAYAGNNPVKYIDPLGKTIVLPVVCGFYATCYAMYFHCLITCRGDNYIDPGEPYDFDCFKICVPILSACGIPDWLWFGP